MIIGILLAAQIQSRATYDSVPPLTLVKQSEIRGFEVQTPWAGAIWGSRLAITPADYPDGGQVLLFDLETGSYLGRLGRDGSGPGEFRGVRRNRVRSKVAKVRMSQLGHPSERNGVTYERAGWSRPHGLDG